jgi:hypothetical protein
LNAGQSLSFGNIEIGKSASDAVYYTDTLAATPAGFRDRDLAVSLLGESLAVSGTGGADIGGFALTLPPAPAIDWFNRNEGQAVDRSAGFRINWEGGDTPGGVVLIAGISSNVPANTSAIFLCTAIPGTKSFGVPPHIVQALPPSPASAFLPDGFGYAMVGVLPVNAGQGLSAPGLDAGIGLVTAWSARAVRYQ